MKAGAAPLANRAEKCYNRDTEGDDRIETNRIQWHPGFYGAAELEFLEDKEVLEFQREFQLSKEPLRIDLLVIKKLADVELKNEIGKIFRRHNIIEYKSPDDGLTIDDFFKTLSYACLYKALAGKKVDEIPVEEITVSIFREGFPQGLFDRLAGIGSEISADCPGVYYVKGFVFPVQVVVTDQLKSEEHLILKALSKHAVEADICAFLLRGLELENPADRNNFSAVLTVSSSANYDLYDLIRRNLTMESAMERLLADVIQKREKEAKLDIMKTLKKNLALTGEQVLDVLNIPTEERGFYRESL